MTVHDNPAQGDLSVNTVPDLADIAPERRVRPVYSDRFAEKSSGNLLTWISIIGVKCRGFVVITSSPFFQAVAAMRASAK
jgi:hypothetical protein